MTEPFYRSLEFERGVTHQAAKGVVDPSRLIEHAENRARVLSGEYVRDPMHIAPGKDRLREAREEAADMRNHLIWAMQERIEDEDFAHRARFALRHICLAYDLLTEEDG